MTTKHATPRMPRDEFAGLDEGPPRRTRSRRPLERDVREALDAARPDAFGEVTVSDEEEGLVLRGRVSSYYTKQLAQVAALAVPGVERFRNDLQVDGRPAGGERSLQRDDDVEVDGPAAAGEPAMEHDEKAAVASLGRSDVKEMTREELIAAILASELPTVRGRFEDRLPFYDRDTLERLVFAARKCCRTQGY